jgi:peptidoglycan/xylan/chitin deacetylase (PgdA/CDA1 family)
MIKRFLKLIISLIFWTIEQSTKSLLFALGKKYPGTCVILYYHVVKKEEMKKFARQLDTLSKLARPISIENPPEFESGAHYAAVTFDDGFRESLHNALPELEKRDIPVIVFIPTGCLGLPAPWLGNEQQDANGGVVISPSEIRDLSRKDLLSFGSHCVTHRSLPTLTDQEAKEEISRSKSDLEDILGRKICTLSFPHGSFEQRDVDWAKQTGYGRVFSIHPVWAFAHSDEFVTGRVRVDPTDWPVEFRLKLLGAYRWLSVLRHRGGSNT